MYYIFSSSDVVVATGKKGSGELIKGKRRLFRNPFENGIRTSFKKKSKQSNMSINVLA